MDPAILLIIVFIVAPLIERLLKAGKDAKQPPQEGPRAPLPRQQQPTQQQRGQPAQQREQREQAAQQREQESQPRVVIARRDEETAATMLPDDLWEILTGQTRIPETTTRGPQQEETYSLEDDENEWLEIEEEEIGAEPPVPARWRSAELEPSPEEFTRPLPARKPTRVVSMEKLEFDTEIRHAKFHDKLERSSAPQRADQKRTSYRLTNAEDVRRAFVLREILGPPKGLE